MALIIVMVSTQLGNMRARGKNPGDSQKVRLLWSTIKEPVICQIHTSGSQFYALNDSNDPNRIRLSPLKVTPCTYLRREFLQLY